jgi:hypothetical protein
VLAIDLGRHGRPDECLDHDCGCTLASTGGGAPGGLGSWMWTRNATAWPPQVVNIVASDGLLGATVASASPVGHRRPPPWAPGSPASSFYRFLIRSRWFRHARLLSAVLGVRQAKGYSDYRRSSEGEAEHATGSEHTMPAPPTTWR